MATANQNQAKAKKTVRALRVVARREGFRRCNRRFGVEPIDIPLSELKSAQAADTKAGKAAVPSELEILTTDPQLLAVEVDLEVGAGEEAAE